MKASLFLTLSCLYSATLVASTSISCFEEFNPLISEVIKEAKNASNTCIATATSKLHDLLGNRYDDLTNTVTKVQKTLSDCVAKSENIPFLQCLQDIIDENKKRLELIATRSSEILVQYAQQLIALKKDKQKCLDMVVDESKRKTDQAFNDLSECLQTGHWPSSVTTTQATMQVSENGDTDSEKPNPRTDTWHKNEPSAIVVPISIAGACLTILVAACLFNSKCVRKCFGKSEDFLYSEEKDEVEDNK